MTEILFAGSVLLVLFAYFGYPLSLCLLSTLTGKPVRKAPFFSQVTVIITAHNEEKRIRQKLNNTLDQDYEKEKLQIIVASDGSTDRTNEIVNEYRQDSVELLAIGERRGKENAQKEAVGCARGEILVFTDVATLLKPEGLKKIVFNFADPSVGCVSSEDRLLAKDGRPSGEGFYVRYEMWLRRLESRVNSLVGLSGSFFAARKSVCQDFSEDMQSDFRTVLNSIKMGYRAVSDPGAIGYYLDVSNGRLEFDRKVRTVLRGLTVFFRHLEFLNVCRYGLFSYQYFCHKLLRWLVPLLLGIAFFSNLLLTSKAWPYCGIFLAQTAFYGLGIWGLRREKAPVRILPRIPMYFLTVNFSILVAWWRYLMGQRVVMWTPSER